MRRDRPAAPDPHARIRRDDVDPFVRGALLLGCGGGGDVRIGALLAEQVVGQRGVELLTCAQASSRGLVVLPVGVVGASSGVLDERLPHGNEMHLARDAIEQLTGRPVGAVLPIEVGGANGPIGLWAAAGLGLPLVDADLCGRAVPRLDQMTSGFSGRELTPAVLIDGDGRRIDLGTSGRGFGGAELEASVRALVAAGCGWSVLAFRPLEAAEIAGAVVPGAVSRALQLGAAVPASGPDRGAEAVTSLTALGADVLVQGRVVGLRRPGFEVGPADDTGWVSVETEAGLARLDLQSELLAVSLDGLVLATTPDVLALLDAGSGQVLDLDSVRVGARVAALRVEALLPEESEEYLRRVGPAAYGLELAAGGASKTSGSGE